MVKIVQIVSKYTYLICCLQPPCPHPVCMSQGITQLPNWFSGGLSLSYRPLPIPDPNWPWGGSNCDQCRSTFYDHFLNPPEALNSALTPMTVPSSMMLKKGSLSTLLMMQSVRWCPSVFSHLTNFVCGSNTCIQYLKIARGCAGCAAATRQKKTKETR